MKHPRAYDKNRREMLRALRRVNNNKVTVVGVECDANRLDLELPYGRVI